MLKFFNLFFLIPFFISCSLINFEEIKINDNRNKNEFYFSEKTIDLDFSILPDYNSAEKIILLYKNNEKCKIIFSWNKSKCSIVPEDGWTKSADYNLIVSGELKTYDERFYSINFSDTFRYGNKDDVFCLMNFENPKERNDALTLTFSKPVNIYNFEHNFSISPSSEYIVTYNFEQTEIQVSPKDKWKINSNYTWKINRFDSENNICLDNNYSASFSTENDFCFPEIQSIASVSFPDSSIDNVKINGINNGDDFSNLKNIFLNDSLMFILSKECDLSSFENSFSISPSIDGTFTKDKTNIFFIPKEPFSIGQEYKIYISKNYSDLNGIKAKKNTYAAFIPENTFLIPINVTLNSISNFDLYENENSTMQINSVNISKNGKLFVQIDFSKEISHESLSQIEKIISLEPEFPLSIKIPKLTEISWTENKKTVYLTYENLSSSLTENYFYKLTIFSNKDFYAAKNKEYMEKNLWTIFKTN